MLPRRARTTELCALLIWKLNGNSEMRHSTSAQRASGKRWTRIGGWNIRQKQQENRFIWESALRRKLNDSPGEWVTEKESAMVREKGWELSIETTFVFFFIFIYFDFHFFCNFFIHSVFIRTEMINVWHKMDAWISSTVNSHLITSPLTVQIDGDGNAKRNGEWEKRQNKSKWEMSKNWYFAQMCVCVFGLCAWR